MVFPIPQDYWTYFTQLSPLPLQLGSLDCWVLKHLSWRVGYGQLLQGLWWRSQHYINILCWGISTEIVQACPLCLFRCYIWLCARVEHPQDSSSIQLYWMYFWIKSDFIQMCVQEYNDHSYQIQQLVNWADFKCPPPQ